MMSKVILKQTMHSNFKWMIAYPSLLLFGIIIYQFPSLFYYLVIPFLLIGFGFDYVFYSNKRSYLAITFYGFSLIKFKKRFLNPEYVSLFKQSFKRETNFGFSPSIINDEKYSLYTIKLFKESERVIVFESNNKKEVLKLGKELAQLLDVNLHNTLE